MGDVFVHNGENAADTATLLLAAAEDKDYPVDHVRAQGGGGFVVDEEIAKAAGVDYDADATTSDQAARNAEVAALDDEQPKPAKKAAAKKTAKKTAKR